VHAENDGEIGKRMIRPPWLLDRVASQATRGLLAWNARREQVELPEQLSIIAGAALLGGFAWIAFTTRVPDMEKLPAEVVFGFLGLYFYTVGYLSGRRTGRIGTGSWAGAASGLAFGVIVCVAMYMAAMAFGVRESVRSGSLDQVAIAVTGLVFFVVMGALCGALGARGAVHASRQRG
jgi:hypothetical protein